MTFWKIHNQLQVTVLLIAGIHKIEGTVMKEQEHAAAMMVFTVNISVEYFCQVGFDVGFIKLGEYE